MFAVADGMLLKCLYWIRYLTKSSDLSKLTHGKCRTKLIEMSGNLRLSRFVAGF
jgi:hypothetical protein